MAINKNKVVTFNDLEKYAGISVDPSLNFTVPTTTYSFGLPNLLYFKGIAVDSSLNVNKRLKYTYYGYLGTISFNDTDGTFTTLGEVFIPSMHYNNITFYMNCPINDIFNFRQIFLIECNNRSSIITYTQVQSLALDDDDAVNDIWRSYHPIIDPSTGEPMRDEEGNILYEEGEYYAETRKIGDPISL